MQTAPQTHNHWSPTLRTQLQPFDRVIIPKDDYAKCNQCKIAFTKSNIGATESVEFASAMGKSEAAVGMRNIYYYGINK